MFLQGSKKPAAMALGFAGEGVEEKGGITMHRLGREEGWRGRKEEGGEVPGRARPVAGGVGVGVGGGGMVAGRRRSSSCTPCGRRRWDGCGSAAGWLGAAAACCPVGGGGAAVVGGAGAAAHVGAAVSLVVGAAAGRG